MEIGKNMREALSEQVRNEFYSAYLYLSMAAYFESNNLVGFGHWMRKQAKEEIGHGMKIFDHIIERSGTPDILEIPRPASSWESPLKAFEAAHAHEKKVTAMINGLVDTAVAEKEKATESFLKWFIDEQVEEEAQTAEIAGKLRFLENGPKGALLMLDHRLGKRE
jgi:ferritin